MTDSLSCLYCQKETIIICIANVGSVKEVYYQCIDCQAVCILSNGILTKIDICDIILDGRNYMVSREIDNNRTIFLCRNGGSVGYKDFYCMDGITDWTPSNVRNKLKTLLPFL